MEQVIYKFYMIRVKNSCCVLSERHDGLHVALRSVIVCSDDMRDITGKEALATDY